MSISFKMNQIINLINRNINIFALFTKVYIFGSVVKNNKPPNDIDLLLVYNEFSHEIEIEKNKIYSILEKMLKLDVDLTILSHEELLQTKFLKKINNYERLK